MSEEMTVEKNVTDEIEMDNVMAGEPVAEPEFDPSALSVTDLATMATVLEAAAQRGAIRANEMHVVGQLYTKLHAFLVGAGLREAPATGAETTELPNAPDEGNTND
jgi:hypothetical protein|tara:strand:- start:162 stop:479 length:318 start_codon:yes stop_codon:yes gene_type:complete